LGGLGFARWAREVQAQERDLGVFFDAIVVCSVTGSTQAGMIAGFADEGKGRRILGIADRKTIDAIRLCARLEGVLTDPVYEGKSMAALIDLIQSGRIEPGSRVLYAHLGGQPALNAYAGAF